MTSTRVPDTVSARALGGTASNFISPNGVAYGLMGLTWAQGDVTEDKVAFACMEESIKQGSLVWSSASFYGNGDNYLDNIKLIRRFFEAYPQYKDQVFLTVKGGFRPINVFTQPDSSEEALREELGILHQHLPPSVKKIDAFGPARVDKKRPIEETMAALVKLQSEGLYDHIFLSEAGAETLERAAKAYPGSVIADEVEYNPFSLEIEQNGVLDVAKKNNIAILAYSPFARGFLTGGLRSLDQVAANDFRRHTERFQPGNFEKNLDLADEIQALAKQSSTNCSPTQLTLAWGLDQYAKLFPLAGSTSPERTKQNSEGGKHTVEPELLKAYRQKVDEIAKQVHGHRYNQKMEGTLLQ
ncbi:unnamed protein product [Sympodiomycopsis kandeliae]